MGSSRSFWFSMVAHSGDKRSFSAARFFISFDIVGLVDEFGKFFNLWCYPHQMIPFTDRFNTVDFAIIPVSIALVYQFFSKWKFFFIAHAVNSAIIAFIGIPLFRALHLYELLNWTIFYSFLTVFIIGLVVKIISDWMAGKKRCYSVQLNKPYSYVYGIGVWFVCMKITRYFFIIGVRGDE